MQRGFNLHMIWLHIWKKKLQDNILPTQMQGGIFSNTFGKLKKKMLTKPIFMNVKIFMAVARHIKFDLFHVKI